jgi:hypothetical protein
MFKKAYQDQRKLHGFLEKYWSGRTCSVFDPLAIPEDFEATLMPDGATRQAFDAKGNKKQLIKSMVQVLAVAGSQHVVYREDFKEEFERQMQTQKFSKVYKKILEFIDEPLDPAELGALTAAGRKCNEQCKNEGFNSYKLESSVVKGRKKLKCVCVNELEDPLPDRTGADRGGSAGSYVGVFIVIFLVLAAAGAALYWFKFKRSNAGGGGGMASQISMQPGGETMTTINTINPAQQASLVTMPPLQQGVATNVFPPGQGPPMYVPGQ